MENKQSKINFLRLCAFGPFLRYSICAIVYVALLTLTGGYVAAEELSVKITANRSQIYIGESFILEITVSGSSNPAEIDFANLKNANIRALGTRNLSKYSITIINGQMTREGFTGFVSSYEVTPLAAGKFKPGPIGVKIDGKLLTAQGPMVTVTDIEKQDRVILSVTASRETTLIDEPFTVTLNLKIKRMAGEAARFEPLFPDDPPSLTIPWLDQEMSGLAGPDLRQLLTGYLAPRWNQPGIAINKISLMADPFDIGSILLREPRKAKFALPRKAIRINGQLYYEYSLQFDYIPKDEGNYIFGPVLFKGRVPEQFDEHGQAVGPNIFAVGAAGTVRVIPPPDTGRPESYSGAIGSNMMVKAALDATNCNIGDPLTLTLTVAGQVKLDKVLPPRLSLQTNLLQHFTIYDNTAQSIKKDSYNQYLYTIRPNQAGQYEVPPLEMSYYDVISRSYKKIFTAPVPLRVRRGTEVTEAQVIGHTNRLPVKKEEIDARQQPPAPIKLDNAGAQPASLLGDTRIIALAGSGMVLYFLIVLAGFINRSRRKIKQIRHVRSAKNRARRDLKTAVKIGRKDLPQAAVLVCETARKYLGERLKRGTNAITPPEAVSLLGEQGVSREAAESFGVLYEKYFNAGFGNDQSAGNLPDDCHALQKLIQRIETELARQKRRKGSINYSGLAIIIIGLAGVANGWASDPSERIFIWNEANALMQNAKTSPDYLQAARTYQRLVDDGVRNGPLFYNIGTALLAANRNEPALNAFERAERYLGRQPDLEHNLEIALTRKANSRTVDLPWYRLVAFWHFYLSCPQRTYIASFAFLAFWLALVLRRLGTRRIPNIIASLSLVVFIVFATSVAASWQMESTTRRYNLNIQPVAAPTNSSVVAKADYN